MTGIRIMEERDICAIETLINQLSEDLGETFSLDQKQYEAHYHAMKQYPDIYHNYVCCIDEIEVGVMKDNNRALSFYRRNGFEEEYLLLGKEYS